MTKQFSLILMTAILFALIAAQLLLFPETITSGQPIAYKLGHLLGSDVWYVGLAATLIRLAVIGRGLFTSKLP